MNKIDLIIDALECALDEERSYLDKCEEALTAARELKELKPVAWMVRDQVDGCRYPSALKNPAGSINGESQPLYTSPRKEWKELTHAQISLMISSHTSLTDLCRTVEAKLKEKNT